MRTCIWSSVAPGKPTSDKNNGLGIKRVIHVILYLMHDYWGEAEVGEGSRSRTDEPETH